MKQEWEKIHSAWTLNQFAHLVSSIQQGARVFPAAVRSYDFDLHRGEYNFLLMELHGIWDETADIHSRLSRASYFDYIFDTSYALGIGLVPYSKEYPRSDVPYLTALN